MRREHIIIGTKRYSIILEALLPPSLMPRICMALLTAFTSSPTVGKKRNMTDSGMVIIFGMCSLFMPEINSLAVVVVRTYTPISAHGMIVVTTPYRMYNRV